MWPQGGLPQAPALNSPHPSPFGVSLRSFTYLPVCQFTTPAYPCQGPYVSGFPCLEQGLLSLGLG